MVLNLLLNLKNTQNDNSRKRKLITSKYIGGNTFLCIENSFFYIVNLETEEFVLVDFRPEDKFFSFYISSPINKLDSNHYIIHLPPGGFYTITTTDEESSKIKSLYIRTVDQKISPLVVITDFSNGNGMYVAFNEETKLYRYMTLKKEE